MLTDNIVSYKKFLIMIMAIMVFCLCILLLPTEANAAILDPSHMDKSIEYLSKIFGDKINRLFSINEFPIITNLFLANLFEIFNSVLLIISIVVLGYVTILSIVNTAQEGQVMGKKWSSIWIPLRSAVGLLLLTPIPHYGYSFLQVVIMWIVLNGVGAADKIWNFVLDNLYHGISISQKEIINKENLNMLNQRSTKLATEAFNALSCINILNKILAEQPPRMIPVEKKFLDYYPEHAAPSIDLNQKTASGIIKFGIPTDPNNPAVGSLIQHNICGEIKICASLEDDELPLEYKQKITNSPETKENLLHKIYEIKYNSTKIMLDKINQFVKILIDSSTKNPDGEIVIPQDLGHQSILHHVIKEYQQCMVNLTIQDAMSWLNLPLNLDKQSISESVIEQGKALGWITAGSYYYLFSQTPIKNLLTTATSQHMITETLFQHENIDENKLNAAGLGILPTQIQPYIAALANKQQYINNLFKHSELMVTDSIKNNIDKVNKQQAKQLYSKLPEEFAKTSLFNLTEIRNQIETKNHKLKPYFDAFFKLYDSTIEEIEYCFTTHNDPLISQAMFGTKLMQAAETFWTGITISSLVSEGFAEIFTDAQDQKSIGFMVTLMPITLIFSAIIWGIGATLAVYTPMVPYMIFIITAIGWFILVIEAIIAAPIIALGFITPSQDELGKVAPSLGIILNMFLKPTLMLLGLLIAAKLYSSLINMINLGFKFTFATLQSQTGSSMFAWIVVVILYTGFIITLVSKCYGLIYQLPDKILRWIGLTGEQTDVSSIKETQHLFDQGVKQGAAPIEGAATAAARKFKSQMENIKNSQSMARHVDSVAQDGSGLT